MLTSDFGFGCNGALHREASLGPFFGDATLGGALKMALGGGLFLRGRALRGFWNFVRVLRAVLANTASLAEVSLILKAGCGRPLASSSSSSSSETGPVRLAWMFWFFLFAKVFLGLLTGADPGKTSASLALSDRATVPCDRL